LFVRAAVKHAPEGIDVEICEGLAEVLSYNEDLDLPGEVPGPEGRRILMPFVTAQPQMLTVAASDLQAIGSALSGRNAAAAGPTTGVVPAAADEVSALAATQFATHAQMYQAVSAQAGAVHEMLVTALAASAGSYAATEAANTIAAS
jgi:hypothetical protein